MHVYGILLLQNFDSEFGVKVELAVTDERKKWEGQSRRAWQEHEQSVLSSAHQEWRKSQGILLKAEVDRARREWERETQKNTKVMRTL